jgi:16S rRNA (guanine(966)-N(2))-methyltransferase RsmD
MRVIAGTYRSRVLKSVPGLTVRPTPDRLRETLFNILAPDIEGKVFVDAFAGTGAVGIEALSRGARRVVFIERDPEVLACLRDNLATLKIGPEAYVVRGSAARLLKDYPGDFIFLDPPYHRPGDYSTCLEALTGPPEALVIAQHDAKFNPGDAVGLLRRTRQVKQGSNVLSFFRFPPPAIEGE